MSDVNTSAVFSAFIEADRALKELPEVRAALAETKALADTLAEDKAAALAKAELLAGTIDALRAELAQKEAELASATFRHSELSKVVDAIRGVLPSSPAVDSHTAVAEAQTQTEAQAETNPAPEQKDQSVTDPTPTVDNDGSASKDTYTEAQAGIEGQREPGPTAAHVQRSDSHTDFQLQPAPSEDATRVVEAGSNPTEVANSAPVPNPSDASTGPTAKTDTTTQAGSPAGPHSSTASPNDGFHPADKPYLNAPYWQKPRDMTHERFVELGGVVPDWMWTPSKSVA